MLRDRDAKNRRLAAIVFTDIVGFSALVNRDEALGARALDLQRRVVRRHVTAFGGREIETAGDSFLLEFASTFAALRCVVAIQRALRREPPPAAGDPPVRLRASIHLGDIEHRGREVFGDGVNIAARLLPFSPEGGLAASDQVHAQIRHRLPVAGRSLGVQDLKNIRHPVEIVVFDAEALDSIPVDVEAPPAVRTTAFARDGWLRRLALGFVGAVAIVGAVLALRASALPRLEPHLAAATAPRRIAVLPFASFSKGEGDALLADGLQDSILTNLARMGDLRVTSRTSVAGYRDTATRKLKDIATDLGVDALIEGSLQRQGDRIMVQVQLIDGATDQHLWAQTYERRVDDLFEVQSAVAREVAGAVKVSLNEGTRRLIDVRPTTSVEAWAEYERAQALLDRDYTHRQEVEVAVDRALALDPGFALAHVLKADLHSWSYFSDADRSETRLAAAKRELIRAGELQPDLPELHRGWGNYYYRGRRDLDAAAAEYETALKLMPNDAATLTAMGALYQQQDKLAEALAYQRRAVELDPRSMPSYLAAMSTLELMRNYDGAGRLLDALAKVEPKSQVIPIYRARLALARGDAAEARRQLPQISYAPALEKLAYYLGDVDEVIRQIKRQPEWQDSHSGAAPYPSLASLASALWIKGDTAGARKYFGEAAALIEKELAKPDPAQWDQRATLAMAYAVLGRRDAARALIERVEREDCCADTASRSDVLAGIAATNLALGDMPKAIAALDRQLSEPGVISWAMVAADPAYRSLRDQPAFVAMLDRARQRAASAAPNVASPAALPGTVVATGKLP